MSWLYLEIIAMEGVLSGGNSTSMMCACEQDCSKFTGLETSGVGKVNNQKRNDLIVFTF